ncbi:SLC22A15 [Mytilus edulis]|uniref:SLC22A15 n=1 Tax=Mytilus edulis TaxID=6550 RepID=A0A8S3PV56_MYTED|nr:SLC22A15 [Mytilus edulis]
MMAFGGVMPDWSCEWHTESGEPFMSNVTFDKKCSLENTTEKLDCVSRKFDESMNTIVSEWDLVCDQYWIVSSITTIQMFGLLIGAFVSGHVDAQKIKIEKENFKTFVDKNLISDVSVLRKALKMMSSRVSCGYGFYAISFGVAQLSGNLYLNMALLGSHGVPSFVVCYFANCIGRKKSSFVFFLLSGITGITVGIVQFLDLSNEGALINGLALTCKLCVACGWMALIIFTSELYPTVVRNIGFGFNNTMSRVGSMIAPQLIFVSYRIPGIMFLLLGGLFIMSAFCLLLLKETNNLALKNTINDFTLPVKQNESLKTVDESETLFSEKCK